PARAGGPRPGAPARVGGAQAGARPAPAPPPPAGRGAAPPPPPPAAPARAPPTPRSRPRSALRRRWQPPPAAQAGRRPLPSWDQSVGYSSAVHLPRVEIRDETGPSSLGQRVRRRKVSRPASGASVDRPV